MFRKTFVRVTLAGILLVAGTLMVMAAWAPRLDRAVNTRKAAHMVKDQCGSQVKEQGEFLLWDALNRALNIAIH